MSLQQSLQSSTAKQSTSAAKTGSVQQSNPKTAWPISEIRNSVLLGDCVAVMRQMEARSVDLVLTDPPYVVRYQSRDGRTIANDDNDRWLRPAFAETYRVLKPGSFCISFYGWNVADRFISAWRHAGFRIVGHLVFRKTYASSTRFLRHQHEQAYLLAKGNVQLPAKPLADVLDWKYTGNRLHPTEKPVGPLAPLVDTFCRPGGLVLDPFCGSGSSLIAARNVGRAFIGIEIDPAHHATASRRIE